MRRVFVPVPASWYTLPRLVATVRDGRVKPEIAGASVWLAMLSLFVLRLGSLNALEQKVRNKPRRAKWTKLLGGRPPSAEAVGYFAERVDLDSLRLALAFLYLRLQRNRHIRRFRVQGRLVLALDGHEPFSSYHRSCEKCCQRRVQTCHREVVEF